MKALEILKDIRNIETEYDHLKKHRFDQAIEELEALQNRSCDNCKFKYVVDSMCTECRCNESPIDYIDFDCFPFFSCNKWEAKNENL